MTPIREVRTVSLDSVDVTASPEGDEIRVDGHAAVWNTPAWIGPPRLGFSERFAPGAFTKTINDGADVRYLFNHDPNCVLARTKNGTLSLASDATGLRVDARLAPTSVGRDLAILMRRGDVNQMSVGMQVLQDKWEEVRGADGSAYEQRTITEAKLFDVSAVTYPAYEETDAGVRAAEAARESRDARGQYVKRLAEAMITPDEARKLEGLEERFSTTPWSQFSQADYTPEQWRRACLIDTGVGDEDSKNRYKLPVREPNGTLNRNGVHAAAARLNQVGISSDKRAAAARKLMSLYKEIGDDPPPHLKTMAGRSGDRAQYYDANDQRSIKEETLIPSGEEPGQTTRSPDVAANAKPPTSTSPESIDERSLPLASVLLMHMEGEHAFAPRALCPACAKAEPPAGTQPQGTPPDPN